MKKILILSLWIILVSNAYSEYDMKSCYNDQLNNCPSFLIGKILSDLKQQNFTENNIGDNGKIKLTNTYNKILFSVGNNNVFLFTGGLDTYNNITVNTYDFFDNQPKYLPKKNDVIIYHAGELLDKNSIKDNYFHNFESNVSYSMGGQNYMGKNEYEFILNGYAGNFVFNSSLQGFAKIYCEDDIIYIDKEKFFNINIDSSIKPSVDKNYNVNYLKNNLQILTPCSNFNKLFGLNNKEKVFDNSNINNIKGNENIPIKILVFLLLLITFFIFFLISKKLKK